MAIIKCKMCGGDLEIATGASVAACEYCGTQQTLPKLDDDRRTNLYDRANHFRRNNEFDKAMGIYEQILNEDNSDAEAYWSLVLCRYGIEYVEDPASRKRIPTVNRAQFTSIFDDDNYKSALNYADSLQKALYEAEAKAINEIQKGILAISQKEEPFDVFICYKESDANGKRTPDSVLAQDLYFQLKQEGFKVFFARITLEDKLGSAYEPYIFAALNSAKVMVVLGTKPEFFKAVWVRNEWSRYLSLIKNGAKKMLIPAYKDMDPYDLPEEFSHLQAQDMSKLGFMQDLIRGIKKILNANAPKETVIKETVVTTADANTTPLLKRAFIFLEDGDWKSADEYCEKVLDIDPVNATAYLGKLMVDLKVRKQESLKDQVEPFDTNSNYQKAIRFGDKKLKSYIDLINARNEKKRLDGIYSCAQDAMSAAKTEGAYKQAAHLFESISEYQDSAALVKECYEKAEEARKDAILAAGKAEMTGNIISDYEAAIKLFESIYGWKDADELICVCQRKIAEIKEKKEAERVEGERLAELARKKAARIAKRNKKIAIITALVVCAIIAVIVLLNTVIIPQGKYNDAVALMNAGKYTEAISAFEALDGYRDSAKKITECQTAIIDGKYNDAVALMNTRKYTEAIAAFKALDGYKDSAKKITECQTAIIDGEYNNAIALMNAGKYYEAIYAFKALDGYKDSAKKITECQTALLDGKYNDAVALMNAGKYTEAISAFKALNGHRDSVAKIQSCNNLIIEQTYQTAISSYNAGEYQRAKSAFTTIRTYKDASQWIQKCDEQITEGEYNQARKYYEAGDYKKALQEFTKLGSYKDSETQVKNCQDAMVSLLQGHINGAKYQDFVNYSKDLSADILDKVTFTNAQKGGMYDYLIQNVNTDYMSSFVSNIKARKRYFDLISDYPDAQNVLTLCEIYQKLKDDNYGTLFEENMGTFISLWETEEIRQLLTNDNYISLYLRGEWLTMVGSTEYHLKFYHKEGTSDNVTNSTYNLPWPDIDAAYYRIQNMEFVYLDENRNVVAKVYKFDFIDANTLQVYCYKNSTTYTLTRSIYTEGLEFSTHYNSGKGNTYKISGYTGENGTVIIPESYKGLDVTAIGDSAFYYCTILQSVQIPDGVTSIGENAFNGCTSLTTVTLPDSLLTIGKGAFSSCSKLETVYIGGKVTSIATGAFSGCSQLSSIVFDGTIAQWKKITKGTNWDLGTGKYIVQCTNGTINK